MVARKSPSSPMSIQMSHNQHVREMHVSLLTTISDTINPSSILNHSGIMDVKFAWDSEVKPEFLPHQDAMLVGFALSFPVMFICMAIAFRVTTRRVKFGFLPYRQSAAKFERVFEQDYKESFSEVRKWGSFGKDEDGLVKVIFVDQENDKEMYVAEEKMEDEDRYYELIPVRITGWKVRRELTRLFLVAFINLVMCFLVLSRGLDYDLSRLDNCILDCSLL